MSRLAARPHPFQHVVFPSDLEPHTDALNLTPSRPPGNPTGTTGTAATLPHQDEAFLNSAMRHAGLDRTQYKPDTLARRLPACLRTLRANSSVAALRQLESATAATGAEMIDALIIGVTSFFRDAPAFARLQEQILPELIAERSGTLRIWSAGCSDGQELYSVAMLLSELNCLLRSQLTGTDCRPNAIRRACAGRFGADEVRTIPPALLERYFVPEAPPLLTTATGPLAGARGRDGGGGGGWWRALDVLRHTMQFRLADLTRQAEVGPFDLILCRNVSIYLLPEASTALWRRLAAALRPGGILMLGKAEFPSGATALSPVAPGFFRRTKG